MISFERYTALFRTPHVASAIGASIIGRIPIGLASLAILLFVQERAGSFALGGSTTASYVLGLAGISPLIGRIIDRLSPRPVLLASAALYPVALIALVVLVSIGAGTYWIIGCALLAGATLPPITAAIRTLYPRLVDDAGLLQTAYSIDSIVIELVFIIGPAFAAMFVALGHAEGGVLLAALCGTAGATVFLRTSAVRAWVIQRPARHSLIGPLRSTKLLAILAATTCYSVGFGLFEVGVTGFAARQGVPAAAGVILGLSSVGSASGALIYGSRDWPLSLPRQFLIAVVAMALCFALLLPVTNVVLIALVSVIAGAPIATVLSVQSLLVSRFAPRAMLAESFTWTATFLLGGIAAGYAAGGVMIDAGAPAAALAAAVVMALCAGSIVWFALARYADRVAVD
jgi:MFS family permease